MSNPLDELSSPARSSSEPSTSSNPLDSLGGTAAPSTSTNVPNKTTNTADPATDTFGSKFSATARGLLQGMDSWVATLNKGIAKYTGLGGLTPKDVQEFYEYNTKQHDENPDVKAHPYYDTAGNIAGQTIATAPLLAVGGPLTAAAKEGAGLFAGKTLGNVLGTVASNAGQGAVIGGLYDQPGQGSDIWNSQGAKTGAILGGALSAPQAAIGAYANKVGQLNDLYTNLSKSGDQFGPSVLGLGKGSLSSLDVDSNNIIDTANKTIANKALNNISWLGTNPYNQQKNALIQDYMENYMTKMAGNNTLQTYKNIESGLTKTGKDMNQLESNLWSEQFPKALDAANITKIPISDQTKTIAQDVLDNYPSYLDKSTLQILKDNMNIKSVDPQTLLNFKHDIYPTDIFNKIAKGNFNQTDRDAATSLNNLYWSLTGDIKTAVTDTPAETAFEHANQVTQANKQFFSPQNKDPIAKAVLQANQNGVATTSVIKSLLGPDTNPRIVQSALGVLDDTGKDTVGAMKLRQVFQKSQTDGGLDIQKFNNNISNMNYGQKLVYQPTADALQGLQTIMNNFGQVGKGAGWGGAAAGVGAVGTALAGHPAVAAALTASLPALSFILERAPIKNSLIMLGKVPVAGTVGKYLSQKVIQQMTNAGVMLNNANGGVKLDTAPNNKYSALQGLRDMTPTPTPTDSGTDLSTIGVRN